MTPEQAVATRILAISAVTALVGTRVYQLRLPQSPLTPAVRVQTISDIDTVHLRGARAITRTRVQVDAYVGEASGVDPYAQVTTLAEAIFGDGAGSGLAGWKGTAAGLWIAGITRADRQALDEPDLRLVRVRQDFIVWFRA